ncbi:MAG TPA: glycerol-3-phosphate 1-O-acyltransferase PlsY [Crinalium sp.]|jgi:glycerol-3-phosphate acyltransferase PlsY
MLLWILWGLLTLVIAYLLGSIPTGYLAGRSLKGIDIREHGSKSTGATNVLRTLGKGPALAVFLIDVLKGVGAIAFARWLYALPSVASTVPSTVSLDSWIPLAATIAGLVAIIAHSRSVWLGWKGGKSVATGLGVMLTLCWPVGVGTLLVFIVVLALFRIVSLGSILAAIAATALMLAFQQPLPYVLLAIAAGLYILGTHRANIQRLLTGTEPRIGQKHQESTEIKEPS